MKGVDNMRKELVEVYDITKMYGSMAESDLFFYSKHAV